MQVGPTWRSILFSGRWFFVFYKKQRKCSGKKDARIWRYKRENGPERLSSENDKVQEENEKEKRKLEKYEEEEEEKMRRR